MSKTRTITPNPPADFTPTREPQIQLQPFRYWCQKVLPLVYDDSLSYYELLCKVVDYLNKTMEDVTNMDTDITNLYNAYNQLQEYVNNYFDSLNVQEEINKKLDEMASDGTLYNIIKKYTDPIVNEQNEQINLLKSRMDEFTSLPPGSTAGNAELQDIRVGFNGVTYPNAGDAVRNQAKNLNDDITDLGFTTELGDVVLDNKSYDNTGVINDNITMCSTQKLKLYSKRIKTDNVASFYCTWDENNQFIGRTGTADEKEFTVPDNATYIALLFNKAVTNFDMAKQTNVWGITMPIGEFQSKADGEITENMNNIEGMGFYTKLNSLVIDNLSYDGTTGEKATNNTICSTQKLKLYSKRIKTDNVASFYCTWDENNQFIGRTGTADEKEFTVPDNATYIALLFNKAVTNFDMAKQTNVWGITMPIGEFQSKADACVNTKIVTIKKDGGDFSNFKDCFNNINPNKLNKYVVKVYEGTYDLRDDFTETEWSDKSNNFKGLMVPDYTHIIGIGDRNKIVIELSSDDNRDYVSTLNLQGTATIENLTIKGTKLRYVIHDDFSSIDGTHCERLVKDCDIIGSNLTLGCVYGSAVRNGSKWIFENVNFIIGDSGSFGFRNHNWDGFIDSATIKFINCRVGKLRLSTLSNNANNINTYVYLYGNKVTQLLLDEENADLYGKGCLYKVSGFGNIVENTVINVTDGLDYSSNIDLI